MTAGASPRKSLPSIVPFLGAVHPLWQFSFYLIPVGMLALVSFWLLKDCQPTPAFNWQNYLQVMSDHVYQQGLFSSLKLSVIASLLSVTLALPLAYAITFAVSERARKFFVFFLLWPFFSNYVTRMFSLQVLCSDQGVINESLIKLGVISTPIKMLYSEQAIIIGLLSILVPVSALIIFLSLTKLDRALIDAARNLGANQLQIFLKVSLPFAIPGALGAFMYSFIVSVGDFVCPRVLGGNQVYTLSILIEDRMKVNDWPTAATLGMVVMLVSLLAMVIVLLCFNLTPTAMFAQRRGRAHEN